MFLIRLFIEILCLHHAFSFNLTPGVPLPHAGELDRIISNRIFTNATNIGANTVFDYLFGDVYNSTSLNESDALENLDISILDPETLAKIVQAARRKELAVLPSRRGEEFGKAYEFDEYFNNRTIEFMRQSIYDTRRRLVYTRPIRKRYHNDISYNIGIIYGTLIQLRIKIDNVYAALSRLKPWDGFLWYLFLYQKCVTLNVDIDFSVQRMFDLQKKWQDKMRPKEEEDYNYDSPGNSQKEAQEGPPGPPPEPPPGAPDTPAADGPGSNMLPPPDAAAEILRL